MKYLIIPFLLTLSLFVYSQDKQDYSDAAFACPIEIMPQYPGGDSELMKLIYDNLAYPTDSCKEGRVILRFVVSKTGEVKDIAVLRSLGKAFDEEAVRVAKLMLRWTPGTQNNIPVDIYYTLPVKFEQPK